MVLSPFLFLAALPAALAAGEASYVVHVEAAHPTRLRVEARLPVSDGALVMAGWGADQMPSGWASFVRDLRVTSADGTPVASTLQTGARWSLAPAAGPVRIDYTVDAEFARGKWPYGNEQAGYFDGQALFIVSKAVFIVSGDVATATVAFDVPAGWSVSTPWRQSGGRYAVGSRDELIDNSLVLGRYAEHVFAEGQFRAILAMLGPAREAQAMMAETLRESLRAFVAIFPRTPPGAFLITLFYGDEPDAEAYGNSAAFSERDPLREENRVLWGTTIAHELFHTWNGHALRAEDYASTQWFSEGFTEYFAVQALAGSGLVAPERYREKVGKVLGLYAYFRVAPAFDGVSLRDAGKKKGTHRLGVYDGGWAAAFCLDQEIRQRSGGARTLATFMNVMYERFGLTGRKYAFDDLVAVAGEVAGADLREFFARYVAGTDMLPVRDCLARAGYRGYGHDYDGELYVVPLTR